MIEAPKLTPNLAAPALHDASGAVWWEAHLARRWQMHRLDLRSVVSRRHWFFQFDQSYVIRPHV